MATDREYGDWLREWAETFEDMGAQELGIVLEQLGNELAHRKWLTPVNAGTWLRLKYQLIERAKTDLLTPPYDEDIPF